MPHITITTIGNQGDGVAYDGEKNHYIPFTAPGDIIDTNTNTLIKESQSRQDAPCPYFKQCGGCQLQHLPPETYRDFKQTKLTNMLDELKQPVTAKALFSVQEHARRRVQLKIAKISGQIELGFYQPHSHIVVAITECLVASHAINAVLAPLKAMLNTLKKATYITSVAITDCYQKLDITLHHKKPLPEKDRSIIADFAAPNRLLRLSFCDENQEILTIFEQEKPLYHLGDIQIELPQNAFLQASQDAENFMRDIITKHLPEAAHVIDLFAGIGTFSIPLHHNTSRITTYESMPEMVHTLHNALKKHQIDHKVSAHTRNLFSKPLTAAELNKADLIILNPPRDGAKAQCQKLAESNAPKIIMISCNPTTAKRDLKTLTQGGYHITEAQAVDQFLWSYHLETVFVLER